MSKTKKIILGIATIWPTFYIIMFFLFIFFQIFLSFLVEDFQEVPFATFFLIFVLHFFTMIWVPVLLVIYIRNVFKNEHVPKDKKALWAVVLFMGNIIAMPIYWYLYVWKEPKQEQLPEQKI